MHRDGAEDSFEAAVDGAGQTRRHGADVGAGAAEVVAAGPQDRDTRGQLVVLLWGQGIDRPERGDAALQADDLALGAVGVPSLRFRAVVLVVSAGDIAIKITAAS